MAKQIRFEYKDKPYTLEFTRKAVKTMEQQGFSADMIEQKPISVSFQLFAGAFQAHHPQIKKETLEAIFEQIGDMKKLVIALSDMYAETFTSLSGDEDGENEGNVKWEIAG